MNEYLRMLNTVISEGEQTHDRTGTGTLSLFGMQGRFAMSQGFPAVTTKKLQWESVVSETLWFLSGSTDERRLAELRYNKPRHELKNKTTIWTANADNQGVELGYPNSDNCKLLGPVYGHNWTKWPTPNSLNIIEVPAIKFTCPYNKEDIKRLATGVYTPDVSHNAPSYFYDALDVWSNMVDFCSRHADYFICEDWLDFKLFLRDLEQVPYFYAWCHDSDLVLSASYFNTNMFSKDTCIFLPANEDSMYLNENFNSKSRATFADNSYFDFLPTVKSCTDALHMRGNLFKQYDTVQIHAKENHNYRLQRVKNQLSDVIQQINENTGSRRMIVSAWDPAQVENMALPPCHTMFQFHLINGKLSLQLYQRSCDMFLGGPFNIASYSLILAIIARLTNTVAHEFIWTIGDAHLYMNHIDQVNVQLSRAVRTLPTLHIADHIKTMEDVLQSTISDYQLIGYSHHDPISAKMAV